MKKLLSNINFKQFLLLITVVYATEHAYAQKERKNFINVNYSFGWNTYSRNGTTVGGFGTWRDYEGDDFKSIAVEYARRTASNTEFCTGLTAISAYLATTTSNYYSMPNGGGSNTANYRDALFILSLPLHLRYHFLKYLFVEGGLNLNYNPSMGYKYGAGLNANIGAEYVFHSGITLFASPFVQWNLLRSRGIGNEHDMGNAGKYIMTKSDKLLQWGIKSGIGYRF
jgi:hypothetical protein